MLCELPGRIDTEDVDDHDERQQLMKNDEIAAGEDLDRSPRFAVRSFSGNFSQEVSQTFPTLTDAVSVLNVVGGHATIDQAFIGTVNTLAGELQDVPASRYLRRR